MKILFDIIVRQLITIFVGGSILYLFYKFKGKKITYSEILDDIDPKTNLKKHTYLAFYVGTIFFIILVIIISTLAGRNPKLESLFR